MSGLASTANVPEAIAIFALGPTTDIVKLAWEISETSDIVPKNRVQPPLASRY
jgi:hypothetical protein